MSLAICCQWVEEQTKRNGTKDIVNLIDEKMLQLGAYKSGKYSQQRIIDTYHNNVDEHIKIVPKLIQNNIKSFRLTSTLFPLFEFCSELAKNDQSLINKLAYLGGLFYKNNIRVTCHPGQFTVISSDSDKVIENSVRELQYHAWIFDMMGFEQTTYYAINIHGGKKDRANKIAQTYSYLPDNVKKRLTLENDEKCYNVKELLNVHEKTGIPIVLDSHHYTFGNDDLSFIDAFYETSKTWGKVKPLQHISNTEPGMEKGSYTQRRAHSNYIHYVPDLQLAAIRDNLVDVDVEAKMKNLAVLQMRKQFDINV